MSSPSPPSVPSPDDPRPSGGAPPHQPSSFSSDSERDRRLLRRAVLINFAGLLGRGLWPLLLFLVARWYGAAVLGQFTLLQAPIEIMLALCSTGFVDGIYRNVARLPGEPLSPAGYGAVALALRHVLGLGLLVFTAATLLGGLVFQHVWHRPGLHLPLILMTATVPLGGGISILAATATAMMRNEGEALIKGFLVPALTVAFAATPLARSYGVHGLASAFLAAQAIGFLAAIFLFTRFASLRDLVTHRDSLTRDVVASQRGFGLTQGLNLMLWMSVYSIDTLLLGIFATDAEIARYRAGSELARLLQYARTQVSSAFVPLASRYLIRDQRGDLQALLHSLPRTLARGGFLLAGVLSPLAVPLLPAFLDVSVPTGAGSFLPFVSILLLGHVVVAAFALSGNTLILAGHQRSILINSAIMTAVNLALGFALIPRFGNTGAATATLVAMTVAMVRQTVVLRLALGLSLPLRSFAIAAGAAVLALVVSHVAAALVSAQLASPSPWPRAVISAASFAAIYLLVTSLSGRFNRPALPPVEPATSPAAEPAPPAP